MNTLDIKNLHVSIGAKDILKGVTLRIRQGEVHALMGPNGSGKSTLAQVLMGHPAYTVVRGSAMLKGADLLKRTPEARAKLGLFLSFQNPTEVPGVSFVNFLRSAYRATSSRPLPKDFLAYLEHTATSLGFGRELVSKNLNEGFSGGEKKRAEILQMAVLEPKMAILDETDSGLDVDALRSVARGIDRIRGRSTGVLVITHYQRILRYLKPDVVHIMSSGKIIASGDRKLAAKIERRGYGWITKEEVV